jgi:hypothetical protein
MTAFSHAHQSVRRLTNSTRVSIPQLREMLDAASSRRDEDLVTGVLRTEEARWSAEQAGRVDSARAILAGRRDDLIRAGNLTRMELDSLSSDVRNGRIPASKARGILRDHAQSMQLMRDELAVFDGENARISGVAAMDVGNWQAEQLRRFPTLTDTLAAWPPAD